MIDLAALALHAEVLSRNLAGSIDCLWSLNACYRSSTVYVIIVCVHSQFHHKSFDVDDDSGRSGWEWVVTFQRHLVHRM